MLLFKSIDFMTIEINIASQYTKRTHHWHFFWLTVVPSSQELLKAKKKAQAKVDAYSDNGISGPNHQEYIGMIVFAKEEITDANMNLS